jgi:hypothetical protein
MRSEVGEGSFLDSSLAWEMPSDDTPWWKGGWEGAKATRKRIDAVIQWIQSLSSNESNLVRSAA